MNGISLKGHRIIVAPLEKEDFLVLSFYIITFYQVCITLAV